MDYELEAQLRGNSLQGSVYRLEKTMGVPRRKMLRAEQKQLIKRAGKKRLGGLPWWRSG